MQEKYSNLIISIPLGAIKSYIVDFNECGNIIFQFHLVRLKDI